MGPNCKAMLLTLRTTAIAMLHVTVERWRGAEIHLSDSLARGREGRRRGGGR